MRKTAFSSRFLSFRETGMAQQEAGLFDDPALSFNDSEGSPISAAFSFSGADKAGGGDAGGFDKILEKLENISPNAHGDAVQALFSGFPLGGEVMRFAAKVIAAAEDAGPETEEGRRAAERARTDRLDPDTEKIQEASWKVAKEFDRLRGLLRFSAVPYPAAAPSAKAGAGAPIVDPAPSEKNTFYLAFCAPDHFVLPLLADHFKRRFGTIPWAIVDEKRDIALICEREKQPVLRPASGIAAQNAGKDDWEELWRQYHRVINNEARANPILQKQFMPKRYWKYLSEMRDSSPEI